MSRSHERSRRFALQMRGNFRSGSLVPTIIRFFFPDPSHTFLQPTMVAPVRGNKTWCVRKGVYWSPSLWVHRSQVSMKLEPFSWCHVYHGMRCAIAIGKNWKKVKGTVVFGLTFFISIPEWHISFFWGFAPWSDFIESELIKIFGFHINSQRIV